MLNRTFFLLLLTSVLVSCGQESKKSNQPGNKGRILEYPDQLDFLNAEGEVITTLRYATADDAEERNLGLMDVRSMPQDAGMVFFFDVEEPQSFWMANTPLPLDIMYVNSDSVIVSIYQNTVPFSQTTLPSGSPAKYVIETNGGFSITHDIREGMKVRF